MNNGDMPANPANTTGANRIWKDSDDKTRGTIQASGLTKREHFAAMAMQGFCALDGPCTPEQAAYVAVRYADALLAELESPNDPTP